MELPWRAGPARMRRGTQGHVAEPREPTRHAGGAQVARTRGRGHGSPRRRLGGATWQGDWHLEGPRVSWPSLGVWGGNANALGRPLLYTHLFRLFPLCGTIFPRSSLCAGHVVERDASDAIATQEMCRTRGPESTRSLS